uniref:Uncharacterized protein n=1 Tax=Oryza brachyantha TaxID=4533 RepID=J3LH92_ORYBR
MVQAMARASSVWHALPATSVGCITRRSPTRDLQFLPNASRARAPILVQLLMSRNVTLGSLGATLSTAASLISLRGISKVLSARALAETQQQNQHR